MLIQHTQHVSAQRLEQTHLMWLSPTEEASFAYAEAAPPRAAKEMRKWENFIMLLIVVGVN